MAKPEEIEPEKPEDEEAAEGTTEESPEEGKKFKLSKKMMLIAGAACLILVGGVVATLFATGVFSPKTEVTEASAGSEKKAEGKTVFYSLGDILVNLSGDGKRPNFLKIKVSLELADEKDLALIESLKPRIIDNFQVYLRELRVEDLRGSAGLYRLREELLLRVTEAAQPVRVRDVLFQEMLVQ